jgi:hypothetical protein
VRALRRCDQPVAPDSIFCENHQAPGAGATRLSLEQRREVFAAQKGLCPVCAQAVDLLESAAHRGGDGQTQGLLHPDCNRLAAQAEKLGREGIDRLAAYLWPRPRRSRP